MRRNCRPLPMKHRRTEHCHPGQGIRLAGPVHCRDAAGEIHRLHSSDPYERCGYRRPADPEGCAGRDPGVYGKRFSARGHGTGGHRGPLRRDILGGRRKNRVLGVIHLKDIVKGGLKDRFTRFRAMGIKTVMITGDNKLTAEAIAKEAGVDDFLAEARPEDKLALIRKEQAAGHLVAMTGDGTNDAPALAQADVGVAMNTGTQAAKEAGNMVDLDSNPTKLIEIVEIGKQMLIRGGADHLQYRQ